jgi:hypothetical protein
LLCTARRKNRLPSGSTILQKKEELCYTVKKGFLFFPSPAGMSLMKLSLAKAYNLIIAGQGVFIVSDTPAGDGKNDNIFYSLWNSHSPLPEPERFFLGGKNMVHLNIPQYCAGIFNNLWGLETE